MVWRVERRGEKRRGRERESERVIVTSVVVPAKERRECRKVSRPPAAPFEDPPFDNPSDLFWDHSEAIATLLDLLNFWWTCWDYHF